MADKKRYWFAVRCSQAENVTSFLEVNNIPSEKCHIVNSVEKFAPANIAPSYTIFYYTPQPGVIPKQKNGLIIRV